MAILTRLRPMRGRVCPGDSNPNSFFSAVYSLKRKVNRVLFFASFLLIEGLLISYNNFLSDIQ